MKNKIIIYMAIALGIITLIMCLCWYNWQLFVILFIFQISINLDSLYKNKK
jgi:hypothetical protein